MGDIDLNKRKQIFDDIKTYSTLGESIKMPKSKDELFESINTKKDDITGFLLDTLKAVAGSAALKELTGEMLSTFLDDAEKTMKTAVKNNLTSFDSNITLPTDFINNGVNIDASKIDLSGKLKIDPNSDIGDLLYDNTNLNFDKISYDAIMGEGTEVSFNNLKIKYDSITNSFTYKPNISSPNINIGEWINDYVDNTEFINKKELTSKILDNLYGTIKKNEDKSVETIIGDLKINNLIDKLINDEDILITDDELKLINIKAKEIKEGVMNFNMSCGIIQAELPLSGLTNLINNISGSTDPNLIANAIDETINQSFENTNNEETVSNNKTSINDNFFTKLINLFKTEFSKIVAVSPQARMLLSVTSSFKNNNIPQLGDIETDLKVYKNTIKCMIDEILWALFGFIFSIVVGYLISLLQPILKEISKEKITAYKNIISNLITSKIDIVKNIV